MGIKERIRKELADAGYWSEDNIVNSAPIDTEFLIATTKDCKQRKAMREQESQRGGYLSSYRYVIGWR